MDLDDLKHTWQQADKIQHPKNSNIMEIIQNKRNGPVAALKMSFRKQMILMTVVPIMIIATNMQHIDKTLTSALFWFYILFCIGVILFAKKSYKTVQKMEGMDGMVKSNLEQQILILETRIKYNLIGIRTALIFFVILVEVLPYFQYFKMLNTWHSLSPLVRFGAYAALFAFQYFVSHILTKRKFGQHIEHLKELVKQMQ